jgi:hypothetical protein
LSVSGNAPDAENYVGEYWINWAERRVADTDPLTGGVKSIFENVASGSAWDYRD